MGVHTGREEVRKTPPRSAVAWTQARTCQGFRLPASEMKKFDYCCRTPFLTPKSGIPRTTRLSVLLCDEPHMHGPRRPGS